MTKLAIIGAGASGLIAASVAAELSHACGAGEVRTGRARADKACAGAVCAGTVRADEGRANRLEICLFEASDKIGRPILKSGNGRCNLTNAHIAPSAYHNAAFVERVFAAARTLSAPLGLEKMHSTYPNNLVASYFEQHGVVLREEAQGRLYPQANKASVVLDALRRSIDRFGVDIKLGEQIVSVDEPMSNAPLTLKSADGAFFRADAVIVATGGTSACGNVLPFLPQTALVPTLGSIATDSKLVKALDNIRVKCAVSLLDKDGRHKASEQGEVMFRKYGVSGIAIFNLSRQMVAGDRLVMDVLPQIPEEGMSTYLESRWHALQTCLAAHPTNFDMLNGIVLPDVARVLLKYVDMQADDPFDGGCQAALIRCLKAFSLDCRGIGDAKLCQVARGGYQTDAIEGATMQAHDYPALFITGESIDVDGPCGGYNLHWACTTGMLAAVSACAYLGFEPQKTLRIEPQKQIESQKQIEPREGIQRCD